MIQFLGRFHVVLVHLPIGILLLACLFQWLEAGQKYFHLRAATSLAFLLGMISAILSALTGYFLSLGGDYDTSLVATHQWFGISVACVSIFVYLLRRREASRLVNTSASIALFLLIIMSKNF